MVDGSGGGGSTVWLAFMVGALVVIVAVIGVMLYSSGSPLRRADVAVIAPSPSLQPPASKPGR